MIKIKFSFVIFASLAVSTILIAQTDLMDDVDAVKENSDEDLYAPDDEEAGANSAAASTPATAAPAPKAAAPTPNAAPPSNTASDLPALEELPVTGEGDRPDSALTGVDRTAGAGAAELSAIRIYSLNDRTRFEIQTSKVVDYITERTGKNKQFTLNLANTNLGPLVSKGPIDAKEYGGPVSKVQAYESKSSVGTNAKIVMNLNSNTEPVILREGNRLLVDFISGSGPSGSGRAPVARSQTPRMADDGDGRLRNGRSVSDEIPTNFETLISLNGKQNFVGTKVNFRSKDASIPDVLQFISQVSGKNFVLVGEADRRISMNVKSVPWDQVLALVLLNADLGYQKLGNTYRVMPVTKIRQEIADSIKAQEDEDKLAPKATQLFPLSYAKTSEVIPQISKYLRADYSENVVSDERTNSIVVTALPKNIKRIGRYIEAIDRQTPVVQIEARIVQARKDFTRDIGIEWKALGGIRFGGGDLFMGGGLGKPGALLTDPTSAFTGLGNQGGGFGNYQNEGGTLRQLDAFLKFDESKGQIKELSRPSLTVLNNKKASIIDGTELTFLLATGEGSENSSGTTKTVKAALSLTVTPQVTNDNNVLLNINLTRDNLAPVGSDRTVNVDKREINTETLVESGATVVIGGVYIKEETDTKAGWPFFRKVPILGRLFTSTDFKKEIERELLMFISPRILNKERASVVKQSLEDAR